MSGVQTSTLPDNTDADVGELGVDDVGVVARRGNECVHDRADFGAGADVLAELRPVVGDACADRAGMADEVARTTGPGSHR